MKLKYFLTLLLGLTILTSYPSLATGISEDPFFNDSRTAITVTQVFEQNRVVKAIVSGSQVHDKDPITKITIIDAITSPLRYEDFDDQLFAKQVLSCGVIVRGKYYPHQDSYTTQEELKYTLKGESHVEETAPLGQWYTVYKVSQYLRPNQTIYELRQPLYQQKKTEECQPTNTVRKYCVGHTEIFTKVAKKLLKGKSATTTQHTIEHYNLINLITKIWQRDLDTTNERELSSSSTLIEEYTTTSTNCSECAEKKAPRH